MKKATVHLIAAARPNFMKIAPLYHALKRTDWCAPVLVHTGQHYDYSMSQSFIDQLGLPEPDIHLGVGSGTHGQQTANVLESYEAQCLEKKPDWVVVPGDVNSSLACALAVTKLHIPVAHLEAGLRSRDRGMPEEINRILTDVISDLLWAPSQDGVDNLLAEGISGEKIDLVGNIMIDSYEMLRDQIEEAQYFQTIGVEPASYGVVTIHRPSNVDNREDLETVVQALEDAAQLLRLVFPVHPRTRKCLEQFGLLDRLTALENVYLIEPAGYCEFMSLVSNSALAVTDSGGLQEETTYLGVPCVTLRENTERPVTVEVGSNVLASTKDIPELVKRVLDGEWKKSARPELWDGNTASRLVASLKQRLN